MSNSIQKVTKSEQKVALSSLEFLNKSRDKALKRKLKTIKLSLEGSKEVIEIPLKALRLLTSIVSNMAEGKSTALLPTETELTTQQAAEILSVSRPHVVKLLELGKIPFKKVGSHRRIQLKDVLEYETKLKKERSSMLSNLAKEAQDLNLGY